MSSKEKKIVIATHGTLAQGLLSAMKIIVGDDPRVSAVSCYTDPDFDMEATIERIFEETDFEKEELIVCTDLFGGSVCNTFFAHYNDHPFQLVTNINLGFMIDLLITTDELSTDVLREKCHNDLYRPLEVTETITGTSDDDDI